ncbi:MAG: 2-oxo acid dehydrogenase subunit E2 [Alphaproteobacteria bacterium]|nr:2-oxo acid dehydrogenase subunit E2 [Rickettsiales bacterium]
MPIEIKMPAMSPTMESGNLAKWIVKIGDKVKPGDIMLEVETDKAMIEVESIDKGTLVKIYADEGTEDIKVGCIIALMLKDGENKDVIKNYKLSSAPFSQQNQDSPKVEQKKIAITNQADAPITTTHTTEISQEKQQTNKEQSQFFQQSQNHPVPIDESQKSTFNPKYKASPLARKIAIKRGVELSKVFGTGIGSRIVKRDVETFSAKSDQTADFSAYGKIGQIGRISNPADRTRVKMSSMRKIIAKKLTESKSNIPHFYLSIQCKMSNLIQSRNEFNSYIVQKYSNSSYRVSVNDVILKAVALAMEENKNINVFLDGDEIVQNQTIDICVAISINNGLIVPKICDVNLKNILTISQESKDIIQRAKSGKITPDELTGGSISISNMGMMGIDEFFPIINPPQSSIIGIGRTKELPIIDNNGNISVGKVMNITISADHRIVDGADAAKFLDSICDKLSNPICLFV